MIRQSAEHRSVELPAVLLPGVSMLGLVLLGDVPVPARTFYRPTFFHRPGLLLRDPAVADVGGKGRVEHLNGFEIERCNPVEDPLT